MSSIAEDDGLAVDNKLAHAVLQRSFVGANNLTCTTPIFLAAMIRVWGLHASDGRAVCRRAKPARQVDALPSKADGRGVGTRSRGLDDRLVSCTGLDRLPVDQAADVLEKTLSACSVERAKLSCFTTARRSEKIIKSGGNTSKEKGHNRLVGLGGGLASAKCGCIRRALAAARSASKHTSPGSISNSRKSSIAADDD